MIDFSRIKTFPLSQRKNKESVKGFIGLDDDIEEIDSPELDGLCRNIAGAAQSNRHIIVMIGGHVIKCGLSLFLIDMMKKGLIKHIAMNGAAPIHDFEFALTGESSEDVADTLQDGRFGNWEETGRMINEAIKQAAEEGIGYGTALGRKIDSLCPEFKEYSVVWNAFNLGILCTIHSAIGTEIIHQHPSCDGAAMGKATYHDFKLFADSVCRLEHGVVLNIGSAVIMPEVFLKALSISRNLGFKTFEITTANIDMNDHYRPRENIISRPTQNGGKGFFIRGKHQQTIPSLYRKVDSIMKKG